jgi:hypothetical protein
MAGIRQVDGRVWLVSFMNYDLGYFAETECGLEPIDCAAPIQNDSTAQGLFVAAEEL